MFQFLWLHNKPPRKLVAKNYDIYSAHKFRVSGFLESLSWAGLMREPGGPYKVAVRCWPGLQLCEACLGLGNHLQGGSRTWLAHWCGCLPRPLVSLHAKAHGGPFPSEWAIQGTKAEDTIPFVIQPQKALATTIIFSWSRQLPRSTQFHLYERSSTSHFRRKCEMG